MPCLFVVLQCYRRQAIPSKPKFDPL